MISLLALLLVGTSVVHAAPVYTVSDLDPVVEGTFQYVNGGEKLMALEGMQGYRRRTFYPLSVTATPWSRLFPPDAQNEMKGNYMLGFTVSKTQDGLVFKCNMVDGKSKTSTMKPGQAVESAHPTDEQMAKDTLSIVSPNSIGIVYHNKNGGETGSDTTTFTKDGATSIKNVNGVNYTFKFRRV